MLTPIYKDRMELLVFSHCTNNGIEAQFPLFTTCWHCLLILAKGRISGQDHSSSSTQIQMHVLNHVRHTQVVCCLGTMSLFPFAHQLIRQPGKIMSHFRSLRLRIRSGLLNIFSYIYNKKFWVSFPWEKFPFSPPLVVVFAILGAQKPRSLSSLLPIPYVTF